MVVFFSYLSGEPQICPFTIMESPGLNPFASLLLNGRLWSEKETHLTMVSNLAQQRQQPQ